MRTIECITDLYGLKQLLNRKSMLFGRFSKKNYRVKPIVKDLRWKDQEELNRSYLPADHLTTVVSQHHINMNEKTSEVSGSCSLSVNDG